MNARRRFEFALATLLFLALPISAAWAQNDMQPADTSYSQPDPGQRNTDPPGRVARIQYMSGEVSVQPGGVNDWIAANMNRPLTTADRVWTDKNSKAELNVGGGYLRMNSETSLTLSNVSDNTVQIELDQGTLNLTVRNLNGGEIYEVDTPNAAFTVMKPGVYRFDVYPNEDQTWATTRQGVMEATGRGSAVKIKSGEQVRFNAGTSLAHTTEGAPAPDGFDDWAAVRNKRLESSQSARYVAPGVVGYEDLDTYGAWRTVPTYGAVWVPSSVPMGWAPYRYGHWVWIEPWGWTWVDDAPWGFAPFHYGRWVYTGGYWGWAPGPYRYWRPCYAPALVAWVGGPGWGIGFGGGGWGASVGWFPLGWGEPFYPWYGGWRGRPLSQTYVRNVNVTNTYINNVNYITNNYYHNSIQNTHYVNRNINGAVTAAPQTAFVTGQHINRVGMAVPPSQVRNAPVLRSINATPTREAVLGGQAPRTTGVPSHMPYQVVTRETPPRRPMMDARWAAPQGMPGNAAPNTVLRTAPGAPVAASPNPTHTVPRPPSAGGTPATSYSGNEANGPHYVPHPPQSGATPYVPHSGTQATGNSNTAHPTTGPQPYVPNPGQPKPKVNVDTAPSYHPPASTTPHGQGNPAVHEGSPPHQPSAPKPATDSKPKPNPSAYVPRPPAGYSYQPAPAAAASSSYAARSYGHSNSYAGSSGPAYGGGGPARTPYVASQPARGSGGYSAAPSYSTSPRPMPYAQRSEAPAAHYSAPAAHYSAPAERQYSGGGGHASGGGGGHASGGGGGRSNATAAHHER